jgi:hypothetical protein
VVSRFDRPPDAPAAAESPRTSPHADAGRQQTLQTWRF